MVYSSNESTEQTYIAFSNDAKTNFIYILLFLSKKCMVQCPKEDFFFSSEKLALLISLLSKLISSWPLILISHKNIMSSKCGIDGNYKRSGNRQSYEEFRNRNFYQKGIFSLSASSYKTNSLSVMLFLIQFLSSLLEEEKVFKK